MIDLRVATREDIKEGMEHLNYAIVLRYIGYNDEKIGNLLKEILEH